MVPELDVFGDGLTPCLSCPTRNDMATVEEQNKLVLGLQLRHQRKFAEDTERGIGIAAQQQNVSPRSAPTEGTEWIVEDIMRVAGERKLCKLALETIAAAEKLVLPSLEEALPDDVIVEWVGPRQKLTREADAALESKESQFSLLNEDVDRASTVLFVHGGAF